MKKIIAFALAIIMLVAMSAPAYAAESSVDSHGDTASIPVGVIFQGKGAAVKTFSVDIEWEDMTFTYTKSADGEWDPATHSYTGGAEGSWSTDTSTITITNHSEIGVNAALEFETAVDGVIGTFTENSGTEGDNILELDTAVGSTPDNAPKASCEFGISGAAIRKDTDLGTITVSIEAPGYVEPQVPVINGYKFVADGTDVQWIGGDDGESIYAGYEDEYQFNFIRGEKDVITPTVIVYGENLEWIVNQNEYFQTDYKIALRYKDALAIYAEDVYYVNAENFTYDAETGTLISKPGKLEFTYNYGTLELIYSNDGGTTWNKFGRTNNSYTVIYYIDLNN